MKVSNERKEEYYIFDVEMPKEDIDILADYGLKRIVEDREELFNYAVNIILREYIEDYIPPPEFEFISFNYSIKNTLWRRFLRYLMSIEVGKEITRKELFDKLIPNINYSRETTLDTYKRYMERAGFLKTISNGKYIRVKDFSIWFTKEKVYNLAYPKKRN